jgi:hypothetical protein
MLRQLNNLVSKLLKADSGLKGDGNKYIKSRVLVVGIYLANRINAISHIVSDLNKSKRHIVHQMWIAINGEAPTRCVKSVTFEKINELVPKFVLLNRLLSKALLELYEYVLICDDDIMLPENFIDDFLNVQKKYNFALAQPARTHNSYIDHPIVEQVEGLEARHTRFVEIGPLVSIRCDILPFLVPFDEATPMGWGLDFVWPVIIEKLGYRMGIIDTTPVDHSIRKPVKNYSHDVAKKYMDEFLSHNKHLSQEEAFTVLEKFSLG